jgi:hypothetical protein
MLYCLQATVVENYPDTLAAGLTGIPVLARVGAEDNTVQPWQVTPTQIFKSIPIFKYSACDEKGQNLDIPTLTLAGDADG